MEKEMVKVLKQNSFRVCRGRKILCIVEVTAYRGIEWGSSGNQQLRVVIKERMSRGGSSPTGLSASNGMAWTGRLID